MTKISIPIANELKNKLSNDYIQEVLESLTLYLGNHNHLILFKNRFNNYVNDKMLGFKTSEELNTERSNIIRNIMSFIDKETSTETYSGDHFAQSDNEQIKTIEKLIKDYKKQLILTKDPTDIYRIEEEIKRLENLK